jgi:uridine kinase
MSIHIMNIVEAYIKFNGSLIILISGLSGSGKTKLAKNIERDFKLKFIDIESCCKKAFDKKVELPGGKSLIDWDDIESFDWKKINDNVQEVSKLGVVVCGPYFTTDVLTIKPDFHIHVKTQKQLLIDARKKFMEENPEEYKDLEGLESVIVNQVTYPHYLEYLKTSKIDKFINAKDMTIDQIYDESADFLFNMIQKFLDDYNSKIQPTKKESTKKEHKSYEQEDGSSESTSHRLTSSEKSITSDEEVFLGTEYNQNLEQQYY